MYSFGHRTHDQAEMVAAQISCQIVYSSRCCLFLSYFVHRRCTTARLSFVRAKIAQFAPAGWMLFMHRVPPCCVVKMTGCHTLYCGPPRSSLNTVSRSASRLAPVSLNQQCPLYHHKCGWWIERFSSNYIPFIVDAPVTDTKPLSGHSEEYQGQTIHLGTIVSHRYQASERA